MAAVFCRAARYFSSRTAERKLTSSKGMVQSKYVHLPNSQWQVSQYKAVATWEEAKQHCESEGATLASPISKELLEYMKAIIAVNNHTTPYFIGFKARHNTEFRSEEGTLLEDVPEAFDMVEQIDPREGDCLSMDGHSIRVEPCWSRLPFICIYNKNGTTDATTTEVPTTTTEDTTPTCGPGYLLYRTGSFYKIHEKEVTWEEAISTCTAEGGYLAIMNDYVEVNVVKYTVFYYKNIGPLVWVGLRDVKGNSDWRSVKGDPLLELYHGVEPSRTKGNCMGLRLDGKLSDRSCHDYLPFVCEKDRSSCRDP